MLRDTAIEAGHATSFPGATPWQDESWRREFLDWVDDRLADLGIRVSGTPTARVRIWSIVVGIPTADGSLVWAKANAPGNAFEGRFAVALAEWLPGETLPALAHDDDRGWWISPDGGVTLPRPQIDEPPGAFRHESLCRFAELQQTLTDRVPEMLEIGLTDRRPDRLPAVLDELLARYPLPDVVAARSRIGEMCAELATSPVQATIDHGDFHDDQIFALPDGSHRFFDWGDSSIAHPFTTLHSPIQTAERDYGVGTSAVDALVSAYLERWDRDDPDARRSIALADRLGAIGRAVTWTRLFPGNDDNPVVVEVVHSLLDSLLEPPRRL